jgi:hypothetical protein
MADDNRQTLARRIQQPIHMHLEAAVRREPASIGDIDSRHERPDVF